MIRSRKIARYFGLTVAFFLLLLSRETLDAQATPPHYYYQGARVPLDVNPNWVAVRFNPSASRQEKKTAAEAAGDIVNFDASVESPIGGLTFVSVREGRDPLAVAARLRANANVFFASPVYDFDAVQLAETNEFLARFPETFSQDDIGRVNRAHNVSMVRVLPNSDRVFVLQPDSGNARSARELANTYVEEHLAEFAEPNFVLRVPSPVSTAPLSTETAELTPNDPNFGLQWYLKNTGQFQGSLTGADISAVGAWNITPGASDLKVAVIDEGVTASHPDLAGKVLTGYNALTGTSETTPKTNDHHGTSIAGMIAANTNSNLPTGIAGVCWACKILPVKVAETDSQGKWVTTTGALASGIDWAWQNGADVLNNSWTMSAPSDSVQLAIINARFSGRGGSGSTIVFASGNEDASTVSFPASLNSYVIAVGASNWCDQRKTKTNNGCNGNNASWGSNYGTALDLVAPGEALYTTCNGNQCSNGAYTYTSGTSLATPLVAGTAALLYALNPDLTPDQIQTALQKGAKDLGVPGRDNETGYGRLDAYRSLVALFNLKIVVKNSKKLLHPNQNVEYTIKYSNTGEATMPGTQIFVPLPANTVYVSSTPSFTEQSSTVYRLDVNALASNQTRRAKFRVEIQPAAAGKPLSFTASINGAFPEFNISDNTARNTTPVSKRDLFLPFLLYSPQ